MDTKQLNSLLSQLATLNFTQLKKVHRTVETLISKDQAGAAIAEREATVSQCPHCDSTEFIRWGSTLQGQQRFKCKSCAATFNSLTKTPLAHLKKRDQWHAYTQDMWLSMTLRPAAKHLGINLKTAYRWRHRMLTAPTQHKPSQMLGICECDETFINHSDKGARHLDRPARKRGGGNPPKTPILVAVTRSGEVTHKVMANNTRDEIELALAPVLTPDTVLVTDGNLSYSSVVADLPFPIDHKRVIGLDNQRVVEQIYHVQTVSNWHSRFKSWLSRFRGVSTRRLENYLSWFRYLDMHGQDGELCLLREAL